MAYVYKQFTAQDKALIPFNAHKQYEFNSALEETVQWYLKNQSWWEPLINENALHPQPWTIN